MSIMEQVADELAQETVRLIEDGTDDAIIREVADAIQNASQTMSEEYLNAVRIRRAELRARAVLERAGSNEADG
ncbi:hypothetical protein [Palleronia abyssalis]|uniref:Uncharacterized protein n=1 Tax=Palleronia abyssalis TaxID=1501240 RepID=A0A2R8BXM1_9RHOB|nr:hypothetical protein [Palleronia abyssalis]SPJ24890.1 hypothetical protein PAA8504_02731 [Palleronia abyssalis]